MKRYTTRFTEKTISASGQWVKITRDNKKRKFTFARGYESQFKAHELEILPFKWIPNWSEAIEFASRKIAAYA